MDSAEVSPDEGISGNVNPVIISNSTESVKKQRGNVTDQLGTRDVVKGNVINGGLRGTLKVKKIMKLCNF